MATISDHVTTASGWFKDVFGTIIDARPSGVRLLDKLPWEDANKLGQQLSEVVWLTEEHGITYHAGTGTGFNLRPSVVAESQELTGNAAEIVVRTQTSYKTFSSAVEAGKQAFGGFYRQKVANMKQAGMKRLEITSMHGGRSLADITGGVSGAGTTRAFVVTLATWAPWIWTGSKNCPLDVFDGAAKLNTNADVTIVNVQFSTMTINVSGDAADLTAVDGAAAPELYFAGAFGEEQVGIIGAVSNTGVYHGIDAATFELWEGNTIDVGGAQLTWDKIQEGIEEACGKGLEEDICLFVSLPSWSNLNSDITALRRIDAGYSKTTTSIGTQNIEYQSMNGSVTIIPSGTVKGGEAFFFPESMVGRFGSQDMSFQIMGMKQGNFFKYVDGVAAAESQMYSDQASILRAPAHGSLFEEIVN